MLKLHKYLKQGMEYDKKKKKKRTLDALSIRILEDNSH